MVNKKRKYYQGGAGVIVAALLFGSFVAFSASSGNAPDLPPNAAAGVRSTIYTPDVPYGESGQNLDVYRVPTEEKVPVALHVGTSPNDLPTWVLELTELGWAVVDVSYTADPEGLAVVPEAVTDVLAATVWVQENAETYGFTEKVVLIGEGVGGLVAGLSIIEQTNNSNNGLPFPYVGLVAVGSPLDPVSTGWNPEIRSILDSAFGCPGECPLETFIGFSPTDRMTATFPSTYLASDNSILANAVTKETFVATHQEKANNLSRSVWLDEIDPVTGSPKSSLRLQVFLADLQLVKR